MRIFYVIIINIFFYFQIFGQKAYWQQQISYDINVDFNHQNHQFDLTEKITYINNSPDNLTKVFFHLYYNAFQPGSMMDVRSRTIADPDSRVLDRIQKLNKDEIENYKKNEYQEENYYYNYEILCFFVKVFFVFIMGLIAYFIAVKYVRKNW